eukprot:TRINITY_DN1834_c0_g1_i17.p1 TRINITY_DN1834_c0_g1~~TRINITY_DN1834_c0_g1_i17.p1  ORF type:complete len:646 (+),score=164.27 TRINITY_DN1834_c0_g1_i17:160-2097(+)
MSILQSAAEFLKEKVGKSKLETALSSVTSDENWNPDPRLLYEIADHSHNYEDFNVITKYIWKKLQKKDKKWRCTLKSLSLIEYLLKNGSSRCIQEFKDEIYLIQSFQEFQLLEGVSDRGAAIREKVKGILELLKDSSKLEQEREAEKKLREKLGTSFKGYGKRPSGEHDDISKKFGGGKYDGFGSGGQPKSNKGKKKGKDDIEDEDEDFNRRKFGNIGSYDPYGKAGEKAGKAKKDQDKDEDFVVTNKGAKPDKKAEDFLSFGEQPQTKGLKKLERPGEVVGKQTKKGNDDFLSWDEPQAAAKAQPTNKTQGGGDLLEVGFGGANGNENGNANGNNDDDDDFFKDLEDNPVPQGKTNSTAWGNPVIAPVVQPQQQTNIPFSQISFEQPKTVPGPQPTNPLGIPFTNIPYNQPPNQIYGNIQPNIGISPNAGVFGPQPTGPINYPTAMPGYGVNVAPVQIAQQKPSPVKASPQKTISMNPNQRSSAGEEFTEFETAKPTKQVKGFQDIESDLISLDGLKIDDKKTKKPNESRPQVENQGNLLTTKDEMDTLFGGPTGGMIPNQPPSGFVGGSYGMPIGGYGAGVGGMGTNPFAMNMNYGVPNNNPAMLGGMAPPSNFGMGFNPNTNMYPMGTIGTMSGMGNMNFQR